MPRTRANGIEIEYETDGARDGRPLLLLRGLGTQLIQWHPAFRQQLADAGHFLVVFDNRDVGLSSHFPEAGVPDLGAVVAALQAGSPPPLAYTIDDMADDVVALMDALEIERAHVAGISMGGMITQHVACRHPERVLGITSIMASTGNPALPRARDEVIAQLMKPAPADRAGYCDHFVEGASVFGSPDYPTPEAELRELAGRCFDRAFDPAGVARQLAAVQASGDRRRALASLAAPTLVIHGQDDPLIPVDGGVDTAASIPGALLELIAGMGHDVPSGLFETLVALIADHTRASHDVHAG